MSFELVIWLLFFGHFPTEEEKHLRVQHPAAEKRTTMAGLCLRDVFCVHTVGPMYNPQLSIMLVTMLEEKFIVVSTLCFCLSCCLLLV